MNCKHVMLQTCYVPTNKGSTCTKQKLTRLKTETHNPILIVTDFDNQLPMVVKQVDRRSTKRMKAWTMLQTKKTQPTSLLHSAQYQQNTYIF